jgi:hypothetical protein
LSIFEYRSPSAANPAGVLSFQKKNCSGASRRPRHLRDPKFLIYGLTEVDQLNPRNNFFQKNSIKNTENMEEDEKPTQTAQSELSKLSEP